jgi:hypothetical protein
MPNHTKALHDTAVRIVEKMVSLLSTLALARPALQYYSYFVTWNFRETSGNPVRPDRRVCNPRFKFFQSHPSFLHLYHHVLRCLFSPLCCCTVRPLCSRSIFFWITWAWISDPLQGHSPLHDCEESQYKSEWSVCVTQFFLRVLMSLL